VPRKLRPAEEPDFGRLLARRLRLYGEEPGRGDEAVLDSERDAERSEHLEHQAAALPGFQPRARLAHELEGLHDRRRRRDAEHQRFCGMKIVPICSITSYPRIDLCTAPGGSEISVHEAHQAFPVIKRIFFGSLPSPHQKSVGHALPLRIGRGTTPSCFTRIIDDDKSQYSPNCLGDASNTDWPIFGRASSSDLHSIIVCIFLSTLKITRSRR